MDKDCGFTHGNNWFRYRAAAIIVEDGYVLYIGNPEVNYYYSVGGGVHMGETSEEAVLREVYEELGVKYEIDRLAVVHENFFTGDSNSNRGMNCHELALYYLMKPRGSKDLGREFDLCTHERPIWLPVCDLDKYKVYPAFMKDFLQCEHSGVVRIVTR